MANERRVVLPIFDQPTAVDLPVPGGKGGLTAVLPAARKLSQILMKKSEERAATEGKRVSCKAGCTSCCHQLVPVSAVEAKALAQIVARLPTKEGKEVRQRFERVLAKLEEHHLIHQRHDDGPRTALVSPIDGDGSENWDALNRKYLALHIACPFLVKDRCTIYEERPFVCREYLVTSPKEHCATLSAELDPLPRPAYLTRAFAVAAERMDDVYPSTVPLPLLLEWAEVHAGDLKADRDLLMTMEVVLDSVEWNPEEPVAEESVS